MIGIGAVIDRIVARTNTNVVVQVQSFGRVFVWDQMGLISTEEDCIVVTSSDHPNLSTQQLIEFAVLELERRQLAQVKSVPSSTPKTF